MLLMNNDLTQEQKSLLFISACFLFFIFLPNLSFAVNTLPDVLKHIRVDELPWLWRLVTGLCTLFGFAFAFRSIMLFKEYGDFRTMQSSSTDLKRPMINLFVAVGFLYFPTLVSTMVSTVYGTTNIPGYVDTSGDQTYEEIVKAGAAILQFIGLISFIRGWLLLSRSSEHGAQPGTFSKALVHVFFGVLLLNIFATWAIIKTTLMMD